MLDPFPGGSHALAALLRLMDIVGAIITMIIGFAWGVWRSTAKSEMMTDAALLTTRAAICAAQFTKGPNSVLSAAEPFSRLP